MSNSPRACRQKRRIRVILWAILILLNALLLFRIIFPAFAASEESGRTYLASFVVVISQIIFNRKFWFYWYGANKIRAERNAKRVEIASSESDLDDNGWADEENEDGESEDDASEIIARQSDDNSMASYFMARASVTDILRTKSTSAALLLRHVPFSKYSDAIAMVDYLTRLRILGQPDSENNRCIHRGNAKLFLACVSESEYCKLLVTKSPDELAAYITELPREEWELVQDEVAWQQKESGLSYQDYQMQKVDGMDGHEFETWCADLLCKNGFIDVNVTPASNDQGVDIIATNDGVPYAIQCKRYSSDLGNTPIQEVFAGKQMYDCHVAVVMTNQHFTPGAKALAFKTGVLLWDRDELIHLMSCDAPSISSPTK